MATVNDDDREFGRNYQANRFVDLEKAHAMSRERIEARVREEVTNNLADQINTRDRRIESLDSKLDEIRVLIHAWTAWAKRLTGMCGVGSDAMRDAIDAQLAAAESARDHATSFQAANVARCGRLEDALEKAERKIDDLSDPSHYSSKDGRVRELDAQLAAVRGALGLVPGDGCVATPVELIGDMRIGLADEQERSRQWLDFASEVTGIAKGQANVYMLQDAIRQRLAASRYANTLVAEREMSAAKPVLTTEDEDYCRAVENGGTSSPSGRAMAEILRKYTCPPPKAPPSDAELAKLACDAADRAQHGTDAWHALASIADALRNRGEK